MTARILLTQGLTALVDEDDLFLVGGMRWHAKVRPNGSAYAGTNIKTGSRYRWRAMHQLLLPAPAGLEVDHIDGNGLNNTRANLRLCTHRQNMANRRAYGTSSFLGVSFDPTKRLPWRVSCAGRFIAGFNTEEDAALAYNQEARCRHGKFARLNVLN